MRRKLLKRTKIKRKTTSSQKADKLFSLWIRNRDKKCVRCGATQHLQCSHFWPRAWSSVRYDPENCDTLCYACHYGHQRGWERAKQGEYRDFKITQLGEKKYQELEERAKITMKRADAIKQFEAWHSLL